MEAKLKKEYILRTSDFDCNNRIHPSSVLDLFQDAAGTHAALLGCSGEEMLKKGLLWVLVSVEYKVIKQPPFRANLTVLTWPLEQKGIRFIREYKVFGPNDELLIIGSSKWVFIDANSRKVAKAFDVYPKDLTYCADKNFEEDTKITLPDTFEQKYSVTPRFTALDTNGHVNNIKYADYLLDALNILEPKVDYLKIEYKKELMQNVPVNIFYTLNDQTALFCGKSDTGDIMFTAKIN